MELTQRLLRRVRALSVGRGRSDFAQLADSALGIPGWRNHAALVELGERCRRLPTGALVVEIGCFLGRSTVMLAGARRLAGSGRVYCVDPFDGSGDEFSVPHYARIIGGQAGGSARAYFDAAIGGLGLAPWVDVRQGLAEDAAAGWAAPVDMLLLDGDQSRAGARRAFELWLPFLRPGGILVLGNSARRRFAPDHDGNALLADGLEVSGEFIEVRRGDTTFAVRAGGAP